MIIVAPKLNGWDEKSADETIELVEYLLSAYNIDSSRVYIEGYSGGGGLFAEDNAIMSRYFSMHKNK